MEKPEEGEDGEGEGEGEGELESVSPFNMSRGWKEPAALERGMRRDEDDLSEGGFRESEESSVATLFLNVLGLSDFADFDDPDGDEV